MKDKFTTYYLIFTIVYAIVDLLSLAGFYMDNLILKIIITLSSFLSLAWFITSIIYLLHASKMKLKPTYRILPVSYIIYFCIFFVIGIFISVIGMLKSGNPLFILETDSTFNQIIWLLGGCYNLFQLVFAYHLLNK